MSFVKIPKGKRTPAFSLVELPEAALHPIFRLAPGDRVIGAQTHQDRGGRGAAEERVRAELLRRRAAQEPQTLQRQKQNVAERREGAQVAAALPGFCLNMAVVVKNRVNPKWHPGKWKHGNND